LEASGMCGWGMLWNASANGMRKSLLMEQYDLPDIRLICWQFIFRGMDIWWKYYSWGSYFRKYNWSELLSYYFKYVEWSLVLWFRVIHNIQYQLRCSFLFCLICICACVHLYIFDLLNIDLEYDQLIQNLK
jgi:hypothetical protein